MTGKIRVLIVDDSSVFREALANFVGSLTGVSVVGQARDGAEALELARKTAAEVVFMDLLMPRLSGVAATRALKQLPSPPAVVICSIYDDDGLRWMALDAGADVFVRMSDLPGEAATLIRRLGGVARARATSATAT